MSKHDLALAKVVYTNPETGVRVSVGFIEPEHLPIAVKETTFPSVRSCNLAIHEAMTHSSLHHPHIVTIYDCFIDETSGGLFTANIVTEQMETDLYEEIENRKRENRFWDEEEMLAWMQDLVSALSYAEQQGISHRDIKPQNIFISGNDVKIGDFGASFRNLAAAKGRQKSLQGSPFFLSPELKKAYIESMRVGKADLDYDPVRSDVYSLGLTLLFMARLQPPTELMSLQTLRTITEELIQNLDRYGKLQRWLRLMLAENPGDRPTFSEMEEAFGSSVEEQEESKEGLQGGNPQVVSQSDQPAAVTATPQVDLDVRKRARECVICLQVIKRGWDMALPPYLVPYRVFAEQCCSAKCLELQSGAFLKSRCPECRDYISEEGNKSLCCGHCIHLQCLGKALDRLRAGILCCPVCHIETRYVPERAAGGLKRLGLGIMRPFRRKKKTNQLPISS